MMQHIRYENEEAVFEDLFHRYPILEPTRDSVRAMADAMEETFASGHKLLICGNGGSAADALHIVSELMKSFTLPRPLDPAFCDKLREMYPEEADFLCSHLEGALPVIALVENPSLNTALLNDIGTDISFAQQVYGLGEPGDMLLCISTSGTAKNCRLAAMTARAQGLRTALLTGQTGGALKSLSDISIQVPETETFKIQELHLPIYHTLCMMLEYHFFK